MLTGLRRVAGRILAGLEPTEQRGMAHVISTTGLADGYTPPPASLDPPAVPKQRLAQFPPYLLDPADWAAAVDAVHTELTYTPGPLNRADADRVLRAGLYSLSRALDAEFGGAP
jgi:hypothetical protein